MPYVKLYKDGDHMGIETNASTEDAFVESFVAVISDLIDSDQFKGDWEFQLRFWLPQMIDIACKYRGYKAERVFEEKVLIAGAQKFPPGLLVAEGDDDGLYKEQPK